MAEPSWTTWTEHASTNKVHVSSSTGNDTTGDGSLGAPYATINKGVQDLRAGFPDWLLLKRGDTWTDEAVPDLGSKYGLDASNPLLISAYGTGARPKLVGNTKFAWITSSERSYIAVDGIHFAPRFADVTRKGGIEYFSWGSDFLVQDCLIEGRELNLNFNVDVGAGSNRLDGLTLRGVVCVDAFGWNGGSSQGIFIDDVDNILIEDCVFDHNGWSPNPSSTNQPGVTDPSAFDRHIYPTIRCTGLTIRRCIFARSAGSAVQLRAGDGGSCTDSLFLDEPIALMFGHDSLNWPTQKATGTVAGNVILGSRDDTAHAENCGRGIVIANVSGGVVSDNVIAHRTTVGLGPPAAIQIGGGQDYENLSIRDNIVYEWDVAGDAASARLVNWGSNLADTGNTMSGNVFKADQDLFIVQGVPAGGSVAYSGNTYYGAATGWLHNGVSKDYAGWVTASGETGSSQTDPSYPGPDRTIATYMTSIGETATVAAFMTKARLQERGAWDTKYDPATVISYVRNGFGLGPYTPPATKRSYVFAAGGTVIGVTTGGG